MTLPEFIKYAEEKNVPGDQIIFMAMLKLATRYPEPEDVPVEEWDKLVEEFNARMTQ